MPDNSSTRPISNSTALRFDPFHTSSSSSVLSVLYEVRTVVRHSLTYGLMPETGGAPFRPPIEFPADTLDNRGCCGLLNHSVLIGECAG